MIQNVQDNEIVILKYAILGVFWFIKYQSWTRYRKKE
jgi:hypothetical protein